MYNVKSIKHYSMRICFRTPVIIILSLTIWVSSFAQKKEEEKYQQESATIRSEIWGSKTPEFAVRTIPAEYTNASKVVIARQVEINADCKTDNKRGFWVSSVYR